MKNTRILFLFLLTICLLSNAQAQIDTSTFRGLKLGQWRQHLPWKRAYYATQSDENVWFATEWAVLELNKNDRTVEYLTKVEGLSDIGMGVIKYNKSAETLVLTYENSNIDLYKNGAITNLPIIKKNSNLSGNKHIYDIYFEGKNAFLACGFGIVKLNLERAEVEYTVFTGTPVHSFAIFQNYFYAATEAGFYRLDKNFSTPADFTQWKKLGPAEGFPVNYSVTATAIFQDQLYYGSADEVYAYDGSNPPVFVHQVPTRTVVYLTTEGNGLVMGFNYSFSGDIVYLEPSGAKYSISSVCQSTSTRYTIEDGTRRFWMCDDNEDFRYYDHNTGTCDRFSFNSPANEKNQEIAVSGGKVFVSTPGPPSGLAPLYYRDGLYVLEKGIWSRINGNTNPELVPYSCHFDMWRMALTKDADQLFIGSWVGGLVSYNFKDTAKCYTKDNSILQDAGASGTTRTAIGGLDFDADGNLWIANFGATKPIAVRKADGSWANFSGAPSNAVLQMAVDGNGYKWFVLGFNSGVMVFDSGQDIDNTNDDRYKILNTSNSVLPTNTVNCIGTDRNGDIWVGTQQGAVTFQCGSSIFDDCTGTRPILNVDGFNGYLLETQDVRCITVDGADRKWFGTTSGIFVIDPDIQNLVARYTDTNSPLFDNGINDIAIDGETGEVFIGTEKGLISLRGEATAGTKLNDPSAYAYPNPVKPDYDGTIAVYGLAEDANVKITDMAGNLVYEGKALGGQAVWNGRDYTGRRVSSGVYLVFATSAEAFDKPDAIITKIVILN